MSDKSQFNKEANAMIPDGLKAQFKALIKRFNLPVQPVAPPVAPAAVDPAAAPAQLTEATLADGTVIKYDTPSLAQGSVVTVVSPEGEMPCPEGEHKLQDGTTIKVVSKDGKSVVESVTPAVQEPAAPAAQAAAPTVTPEQVAAIQKVLQGYEAAFASHKTEKENLIKELNEVKEKFTAMEKNVSDFMALFNDLMEVPSAQPVEKPKNKQELKGINKFINRAIN